MSWLLSRKDNPKGFKGKYYLELFKIMNWFSSQASIEVKLLTNLTAHFSDFPYTLILFYPILYLMNNIV